MSTHGELAPCLHRWCLGNYQLASEPGPHFKCHQHLVSTVPEVTMVTSSLPCVNVPEAPPCGLIVSFLPPTFPPPAHHQAQHPATGSLLLCIPPALARRLSHSHRFLHVPQGESRQRSSSALELFARTCLRLARPACPAQPSSSHQSPIAPLPPCAAEPPRRDDGVCDGGPLRPHPHAPHPLRPGLPGPGLVLGARRPLCQHDCAHRCPGCGRHPETGYALCRA